MEMEYFYTTNTIKCGSEFMKACVNGNLDYIKENIKSYNCLSINEDGDNYITLSAKHKKEHVLEFLLESKKFYIDVKNNENKDLLDYVLELKLMKTFNKYKETLKLFKKRSIHRYDLTDIEVIKMLIELEFDMNTEGKNGWTALMYASRDGHTEIVELLLRVEGIDFNAKDKNGYTALMSASYNGHTEIVELLLRVEGIDVNTKDKDGDTALRLAASNGHTEIVKLLLGVKGIDVNAKNNDGWTILMSASYNGHTEIVELLLDVKRIDVNTKSDY